MKIESKAVHVGDRKKPGDSIPSSTPIYTASTFFYDDDGSAGQGLRRGDRRSVVLAIWQPDQ